MKPIKQPGEKTITVERTQEGVLYIEVYPLRALIGLAGGLLLAATLLGLLALGSQEASAFSSSSYQEAPADVMKAPQAPASSYPTSLRKFYLNNIVKYPNQAISACAAGYHFASMWELMDTSNLQYAYNNIYAYTTSDSGEGPPQQAGWVRTGFGSYQGGLAGEANCWSWTTTDSSFDGTLAILTSDWTTGTNKINDIWQSSTLACDSFHYVWCIED